MLEEKLNNVTTEIYGIEDDKGLFVRDGIISVADYNSTRVGVVVVVAVVVVVNTFLQWDNLKTL